MKQIKLTVSVVIAMISIQVNAQWTFNGTHIQNTNAGNVGINTATPAQKLTVRSPNNNVATNIAGFLQANGNQGIGIGQNTIRSMGSAANVNMTFATKGSGIFTFNTNATDRLRIQANGNLEFVSGTQSIQFANPGAGAQPMMFMLKSGTGNPARMVLAHSPDYPTWGLRYSDNVDQFDFVNAGTSMMSINLGSGDVGIAGNQTIAGSQTISGSQALAGNQTLSGNLTFNSDAKSIQFALPGTTPAPMMFMFPSGTGNTPRMVIAHSPDYPTYGLQYTDNDDRFDFLSGGSSRMTVNLGFGGTLGIGTTAPAYQLELSQNSAAKPGSSLWTVSSDNRLKKNTTDFRDGLNVLMKMHPVWFEYNGLAKTPKDQKFVGIIAQEQQKIAPYMISSFNATDDKGAKTQYLNYDANALLYIMVNSIKEQQNTIIAQNKKIDELTDAVNNLQKQVGITKSSEASSVGNDVYLKQNIPNPLRTMTSINYSVPQNAKNVQLLITGNSGKTLRQFPLAVGNGVANIDVSSLSSGTYHYSLLVDGKIIESKKMVVAH